MLLGDMGTDMIKWPPEATSTRHASTLPRPTGPKPIWPRPEQNGVRRGPTHVRSESRMMRCDSRASADSDIIGSLHLPAAGATAGS
jgi:hypothetical protein